MSHAAITNVTPLAFEPLFLSDDNGQPVLVCVIKATVGIGNRGRLFLAEKQEPVNITGESWGEPGKSSYKYEPETALQKLATDVVLIGDALAHHSGDTQVDVTFRVGPLAKMVRVTGDRHWLKAFGSVNASRPQPFESIPLIYERAFGGYDPSSTEDAPAFDRRNPVGVGYHVNGRFHEGLRLPNVENPASPIKNYGDRPEPAGFGFLSPDWSPRAKLAGTYDPKWMRDRMPLLPEDFDLRFFSAASPGLVAPALLTGDEEVSITNVTPDRSMAFRLPGISSPTCHVELDGSAQHDLDLRFDTLIVNTRESQVFQIWRSRLALRKGPHDVTSIVIRASRLPKPGEEF